MKVLHINYSRTDGAGNAVRRLNDALNNAGVESEMIFFKPYARETARIGWIERKLNGLVNILFSRIFKLTGINVMPTSLLRAINVSDADVVHLHWINPEMLSIEQIACIRKPLVWTFHDMWPVCGREDYVEDDTYTRGEEGFSGLSRWVWKRKKRMLSRLAVKPSIITPSAWMSECVRNSVLFRGYEVTTLANGLDLDIFRPIEERRALREKYGLPPDKKIILFGAFNIDHPRKGGDLLAKALGELGPREDVFLAVFGRPGSGAISGFNTVWLGRIEGDHAMAEVCNCADVALVPSRQETFGQTASEPQACGVPVVAFDTTGLQDIVVHKTTGYLVRPFDELDFAQGIDWVLSAPGERLRDAARKRAEERLAYEGIARQVLAVYEDLLCRARVGHE